MGKSANLKRQTRAGYSLVELLIFIIILSLGFVAIVGTVAYGIRAMTDAKLRQQAIHLNDEALEWIRAYRDICGFSEIYNRASPSKITYCFSSLPFTTNICSYSWSQVTPCPPIDNALTRQVSLQRKTDPNGMGINDDVYVSIETITSWNFGEKVHSVTNTSYFSNY